MAVDAAERLNHEYPIEQGGSIQRPTKRSVLRPCTVAVAIGITMIAAVAGVVRLASVEGWMMFESQNINWEDCM